MGPRPDIERRWHIGPRDQEPSLFKPCNASANHVVVSRPPDIAILHGKAFEVEDGPNLIKPKVSRH